MGYDENGLFLISERELVCAFSKAFARTLRRDAYLFEESKPQERTFMFRFAQELRNEFLDAEYPIGGRPVLSLDVEYNRDGTGLKYEDPNHPSKKKWVAPDIILHERGSGDYPSEQKYRNDVFVCEMKKDAPYEEMTDAQKAKQHKIDADTVVDFIRDRKYKYGVDFCQFAVTPARFDLYTTEGDFKVYKFNYDSNMFEEERN